MRNRNAKAQGNAKKMSNRNAGTRNAKEKLKNRGNAKVHRNACPSLEESTSYHFKVPVTFHCIFYTITAEK